MISFLRKILPQRHPVRIAWSKSKALFAAARYGFPARKLHVIAVTGTDGKTTTVGMAAHILHNNGIKVGAASTAFFQIEDDKKENDTHLTSLNPFLLHKFLRELVSKGCTHAVVEMSSHGLVQGRSNFTWPEATGITNTSPEHLDYHASMDQYRKDKGIMFAMLRGKGTKVLNGADESFALYKEIPSEQTIVYNTDNGDLSVSNIKATSNGSTATLLSSGGTLELTLNIPGTYNLENAQCAIGLALAMGVSLSDAVNALESFRSMPGRMELIDEGQSFKVFVDFTMTANGYKKTLQALRAIVGNDQNVLVLGSCCGNRMKEKRPEIGRVCSEYADVVVISEDETYGEDPHKVQEEVWAGVDQSKTDAHKIFDRREAITFLFRKAKPGDGVVLCGMGPFGYMTKLEGEIEWDERKVAREILQTV